MASMEENDKKLVLKYDDKKGNFTFKNFIPAASDENLFDIAVLLNQFQNEPLKQVVKVTTSIITA